MKVLVIVALAKYYAEIDRDYLEFSDLLVGGLITAVPMLLILLQGDLGTAITFPPIFESANRDYYFWLESPDAVLSDSVTLFRWLEDNSLVFSQRFLD